MIRTWARIQPRQRRSVFSSVCVHVQCVESVHMYTRTPRQWGQCRVSHSWEAAEWGVRWHERGVVTRLTRLTQWHMLGEKQRSIVQGYPVNTCYCKQESINWWLSILWLDLGLTLEREGLAQGVLSAESSLPDAALHTAVSRSSLLQWEWSAGSYEGC